MIGVIIGIYNDPTLPPIEQVRRLAYLGGQFWSTTHPEAERIEDFLPQVNTLTAYQPDIGVLWLRCQMPEDYVRAFQAVWEEYGQAYLNYFHQIIFLLPDEEGVYPAEPQWEEPIEIDGVVQMLDLTDENGTIIGQRVQTMTRRVGGLT